MAQRDLQVERVFLSNEKRSSPYKTQQLAHVPDQPNSRATECTPLLKVPAGHRKDLPTKTYPVRWYVLVVFCLQAAASNTIWITFGPISDVLACYYDVGLGWINTLSLTFFITYLLLFIPAVKFLETLGLRSAAITSACVITAGVWLRFAGTGPSSFWLLLLGQTIASLGNILMWSAPSLISSVWFSPSERPFTTALSGAFAPVAGLLVGMPVAPFIVHSSDSFTVCNSSNPLPHSNPIFLDWQARTQQQLIIYLLCQAILISLLVPLSLGVPSAPCTAPSLSKQLQNRMQKTTVAQSLLKSLKNVHYILLAIVFTLFLAVSGVWNTIVEEVLVTSGYEMYHESMGYLGIINPLMNIIGIFFTGLWLSYSKKYYFTALLLSVGTTLSAIMFSFAVQLQWNFYLVAVLFSFTMTGCLSFQGIAYEFAVEITYPQPEAISASILNASSQLFGIVLMYAVLPMIVPGLAVYSSWVLTGIMLAGTLVMVFTKPKLRRIEIDT